MDPNGHKKNAFSWGIVGVNLDEIEVPRPKNIQNDAAFLFDQDPLEFEGEPLSPRPLPRSEPTSLFNRLPEAFGEEDKLPYSWMARNPGKVAECLENKYLRPGPLAARAANMSVVNAQGEMQLEQLFKRPSSDPFLYFFRVAAFCCIMDLNKEGLIYPSILATIMGRLFNGDMALMTVFNQYFMPRGLHIEYTTSRGAVDNILFQIKRHLAPYLPSSIPPSFGIIIKVLNYMAQERMARGVYLNETVGKLVSTSNGRDFHPHPGLYKILRGPALSGRFMKQTGGWWPYKDVTWQEADLLGLHTRSEAKREDPVKAVDPRRLEVRREVMRDARAESMGEYRGEGSGDA